MRVPRGQVPQRHGGVADVAQYVGRGVSWTKSRLLPHLIPSVPPGGGERIYSFDDVDAVLGKWREPSQEVTPS